jgi:hemolysin III-related protein
MLGKAVMPGEPLRVTPGWRSPGTPGGHEAEAFGDIDGFRAGQAGAISAAGFFDARRGIYYAKPAWRGWLHLIWFGMSQAVGTLLVASAHGTERITSGAIYATSVSAMFGVSALYHRVTWTEA